MRLEYATIVWEMLSSSKVLEMVASPIDLTTFLGMPFLLHSLRMNSLLGLARASSGTKLVEGVVNRICAIRPGNFLPISRPWD